MENLNFYIRAIAQIGVPSKDLFDVSDLYEGTQNYPLDPPLFPLTDL